MPTWDNFIFILSILTSSALPALKINDATRTLVVPGLTTKSPTKLFFSTVSVACVWTSAKFTITVYIVAEPSSAVTV